jgi:hypothetical protein
MYINLQWNKQEKETENEKYYIINRDSLSSIVLSQLIINLSCLKILGWI